MAISTKHIANGLKKHLEEIAIQKKGLQRALKEQKEENAKKLFSMSKEDLLIVKNESPLAFDMSDPANKRDIDEVREERRRLH
jgi:hypothetical protein